MNTPETEPKSTTRARNSWKIATAVLSVLIVGFIAYTFWPRTVAQSPVYRLILNGAPLHDQAAFTDAISDENVRFRKNMKLKAGSAEPTVPPGWADVGEEGDDSKMCLKTLSLKPQPLMGQQVTQRVGFNNVKNLRDALEALEPTP